jgi:hypothetical protein
MLYEPDETQKAACSLDAAAADAAAVQQAQSLQQDEHELWRKGVGYVRDEGVGRDGEGGWGEET